MPVAAIVPAAGRGERLGGDLPKALHEVRGHPLVWHAVDALARGAQLLEVVVVAPREHAGPMTDALVDVAVPTRVVAGGASRQVSVAAGLDALDPRADLVLVHDAARPLLPPAMVARVVAALAAGAEGVVPVVPAVDTIKQVDDAGLVVATLVRSNLRMVQTPQGFRRDVLARAHACARAAGVVDASDDATLLERLGRPVRTVAGDGYAFKVTHPVDLTLLDLLLGGSAGRLDRHRDRQEDERDQDAPSLQGGGHGDERSRG